MIVAALGFAALVLGAARTRSLRPGLGMMLDLFLAAGLLRLAGGATYRDVFVAAIVVAVRRLAGRAIRSGHGGDDEGEARGAAPQGR